MRTSVRNKIGTDVKKDIDVFLREYQNRKDGKSFRVWLSKFPTINRVIGGYLGGNMYTWYGRSGRGKSVFTMEEALEAAVQGANVLIWSMEMPKFQWMARAYSSLSARDNIVQAEVNGQVFAAGFENTAMLRGKLPEEFEEGLHSFLVGLNESLAGTITLRAVDDKDFDDRSLRALEADIIATKADVVIIDPFYYLDYERNTSKTTGGDAAATSMKIRRLTGKYGVVTHAITQADEIKDDRDEEGNRELNPAKRAEIKKTKQVLEDAAAVFGIDSLNEEGRGIISLGKGRDGGEDTEVEVVYLPNYGIVREITIDTNANKFKVSI
nr:AAA family ATPase [Paenibacillus sp. ACRRX]